VLISNLHIHYFNFYEEISQKGEGEGLIMDLAFQSKRRKPGRNY
jgi:hypothetical protein